MVCPLGNIHVVMIERKGFHIKKNKKKKKTIAILNILLCLSVHVSAAV